MAIQELNQVEIESVAGGFNNILTGLPVVGPIVNFLFNGQGEVLGGELLTNPLGIVTGTLNNGVALLGGLLGAVLAVVTNLVR